MKITKANFALAKTVKAFEAEENINRFALHITGKHTEITDGHFAIRMAHSPQNEFEFAPEAPLDICLHPEDAINIASSLTKDEGVKAILPADDGDTVQIEFESGEIRILKPAKVEFPNIAAFEPSGPVGWI